MHIDFSSLTTSERYFQMIQTLIPRPIAWVLSEHSNGLLNLAPFSYFSAVCSDPPLLMISAGRKSADEPKDTVANIEERNHFVIHIPSMAQMQVMNDSAMSLPADQSEVERLGLEICGFDGFALPRLKDCRAAFACKHYESQKIGNGGQTLIFGEIQSLYLDDAILDTREDGRIKVNAEKLNPVARLGANEYASLSEVIEVKRPK